MKRFTIQLIFVIILGYSYSLLAQENGSGWGSDSLKTAQYISLYRDFFNPEKQKFDFEEAYPYWQYVFQNGPGARKFVYFDGVEIIKKFIEKEKDTVKKEKLIDTLLMIYDQRIKYFGESGSVLGRKGLDMMRFRSAKIQDILNNFNKTIEQAGNKTDYFVIAPYFSIAIQGLKSNLLSKEELFTLYQNLSVINEDNISKDRNADKYKNSQEALNSMLAESKIISNCEDAKSIYEKKYKENTENSELWKKIVDLMKNAGCTDDPMYLEVLEKLHKKEPSATTAYFLGRTKSIQGKYTEALNYLNQAVDVETDSSKKADYFIFMANIYYRMNDFPSARTRALKAASLKSQWGDPYLLIGDLYGSSGKLCGQGGFESQVVTWPAIDMYQKAKNIDPSIAEEANKKIGNYIKYMPSKDDIFFRELKEGDTYKVECWINENTTVRSRKE